jgi:hypothetical protein
MGHLLEAILFLGVFGYVFWQVKNNEYKSQMKKDTMTIFGSLALFFLSLTVSLFYLGEGTVSNTLSSAVIVAPHMFLFVAMGYMWKVICSFLFSSYEKYMKVFYLFGAVSVLISVGILAGAVPVVASKFLPLSVLPIGLAISGVGYYTVFRTGPADTEKVFLFTTGVLFIAGISIVANNLYQLEVMSNPAVPIASNIIGGVLFALSMYWSKVEGVEW